MFQRCHYLRVLGLVNFLAMAGEHKAKHPRSQSLFFLKVRVPRYGRPTDAATTTAVISVAISTAASAGWGIRRPCRWCT